MQPTFVLLWYSICPHLLQFAALLLDLIKQIAREIYRGSEKDNEKTDCHTIYFNYSRNTFQQFFSFKNWVRENEGKENGKTIKVTLLFVLDVPMLFIFSFIFMPKPTWLCTCFALLKILFYGICKNKQKLVCKISFWKLPLSRFYCCHWWVKNYKIQMSADKSDKWIKSSNRKRNSILAIMFSKFKLNQLQISPRFVPRVLMWAPRAGNARDKIQTSAHTHMRTYTQTHINK